MQQYIGTNDMAAITDSRQKINVSDLPQVVAEEIFAIPAKRKYNEDIPYVSVKATKSGIDATAVQTSVHDILSYYRFIRLQYELNYEAGFVIYAKLHNQKVLFCRVKWDTKINRKDKAEGFKGYFNPFEDITFFTLQSAGLRWIAGPAFGVSNNTQKTARVS